MTDQVERSKLSPWWPTFLKHRRLLMVFFAVSVAVAVGVSLLGFWDLSFLGAIVTAGYWIYVALPASALMLVLWRARKPILTVLGAVAASLVILGALLVPANIAGMFTQNWQVKRSMRQTEAIAQRIDEYHTAQNRYPRDLDELTRLDGKEVRLPRLATSDFYSVANDLQHYTLRVESHDGLLSTWYVYDSATREWTDWD